MIKVTCTKVGFESMIKVTCTKVGFESGTKTIMMFYFKKYGRSRISLPANLIYGCSISKKQFASD